MGRRRDAAVPYERDRATRQSSHIKVFHGLVKVLDDLTLFADVSLGILTD